MMATHEVNNLQLGSDGRTSFESFYHSIKQVVYSMTPSPTPSIHIHGSDEVSDEADHAMELDITETAEHPHPQEANAASDDDDDIQYPPIEGWSNIPVRGWSPTPVKDDDEIGWSPSDIEIDTQPERNPDWYASEIEWNAGKDQENADLEDEEHHEEFEMDTGTF
jgi:hypothetical protein